MHASTRGATDAIKILVEAGADVNAKSDNGTTPLIQAASNNRLEAIRLLLEQRADPDARHGQFSATALHWTAGSGRLEATQALIAGKANLNLQDKAGRTALMMEADNGNLDVVKALLDAKADITLADSNGQRAVDWARKKNHTAIVKLLEASTE
jgi:ankyrin repeat protein